MLLCVHVPAFRLAVARRERHDIPADEPAVLADKPDRGRIIEVDSGAHKLGARIGQTVLQARAAAGGVHVLVHDAARSHAVWADMLDALDGASPLVDDSGEGTAYLGMRGIGGGTVAWITSARQAVRGFDLPVRIAAGPNKFAARALTFAPDGRIERLPVDVLNIEPRAAERLRLLGVRTLEDLAKLPHGPFVRRFGKDAAVWHERARGVDPTPLRPRAHELQIDAAVFGEGTVEQEEQVYFALRVLADRVCSDLSRAGKAATLVRMTFECENGDIREIDTGFAQATADSRTMLDVMRAKLEGSTFDSPITGLRMQAMRLEECGMPAALFGQNDIDRQAFAVALARLHAATGSAPLRARVRPAARLEARFGYEEFDGMTSTSSAVLRHAQHDKGALRDAQHDKGALRDAQHDKKHPAPAACHPEPVASALLSTGSGRLSLSKPSTSVPQLRLLTVREIAVTMRGNTPAKVGTRAVLDCAGPWRVDDGWFETPILRDEFDVLLDDGMLCRIYHQGQHWYLRGAYD